MKEQLEEICRGHCGSDWEPLYKELLQLINKSNREAVRGFAEWLNAHDFLFRDNMIMKLYETYLQSLIEVPRTRDEINNALLESEIYKVAYRKGLEDGVKGFVGWLKKEATLKGPKQLHEIDKDADRVFGLAETYLQSLDKGEDDN